MTGRFDTLIYTDCRSGQGLRGDPGLQFQAKSPGISAGCLDLTQRALLYEPPTGWINESRSTEDYPPSLAHVWDPSSGVLATAQGAYLGQEVNTMREGNQITHAIVTTDPDSYGLIRPAQLLHAPFWTTKPAPSTECQPLEDGWQPGAAEPEALRDFVAAQEDGRALLVTLLSALGHVGERGASRVLFVAERPEDVIQWIAAATLILPQRQALGIGFKVFTMNPNYCPQPVLAVHPDWAGPYRSTGTSSGFVVLDLVTRRYTDVPADQHAQRWADLFLTDDPYDVMDAVELASTVADGGAAVGQAGAVAIAATFGRVSHLSDVPLAARWVAEGAAGLVADHGEAVVATLLGNAGPADLRCLDMAAASGRVPGAGVAIRTALLHAEIDSAVAADRVSEDRLPALPRAESGGTERKVRADIIIDALRSASDESVDALLRVAWRHRLTLPVAGYSDRVARFIGWWADRPELGYNPARWPDGTEILRRLRDELSTRLSPFSGLRDDTAGAVRRRWWPLLLDTAVDLSEPLDAIVMVGAMDAADNATRTALVRRVITGAASSPDSGAAMARACEVLWCERGPGALEALTALELVPSRVAVTSMLTDALRKELDAGWQCGDLASALDALQILRARRLDVPENCQHLHQEDRRLQNLCVALLDSADRQREILKRLRSVDETVVTARADRLAAALSQLEAPDFVARLLEELPPEVGTAFLRLITRDYPGQPAQTIRKEFLLLEEKRLPVRLRAKLEGDLRQQLALGEASLLPSVRSLLADDGKAVRADWEAWLVGWPDRHEWLTR